MDDHQMSAELSSRASRLALSAIVIAFVVDGAYLLIALTWSAAASAAGPWQDVDSSRWYSGLVVSDVALAAGLLLALSVLTLIAARWPRLVAGVWALTGLTALVAAVTGAWVLLTARVDDAGVRAVLDITGDWLAVSPARLLVLSLLLLAQCTSALLILLAARIAIGREPVWFVLHCVFAFPLAYGVYVGALGFASSFAQPGQDALYYLVNSAIALAPANVYAAAVILLIMGRRNGTVWLVLLACGAALSLFYATAWWQYRYWPDLLLASLSLTVLSGALLLRTRGVRHPVVG